MDAAPAGVLKLLLYPPADVSAWKSRSGGLSAATRSKVHHTAPADVRNRARYAAQQRGVLIVAHDEKYSTGLCPWCGVYTKLPCSSRNYYCCNLECKGPCSLQALQQRDTPASAHLQQMVACSASGPSSGGQDARLLRAVQAAAAEVGLGRDRHAAANTLRLLLADVAPRQHSFNPRLLQPLARHSGAG